MAMGWDGNYGMQAWSASRYKTGGLALPAMILLPDGKRYEEWSKGGGLCHVGRGNIDE
jgi:hypothetical protein